MLPRSISASDTRRAATPPSSPRRREVDEHDEERRRRVERPPHRQQLALVLGAEVDDVEQQLAASHLAEVRVLRRRNRRRHVGLDRQQLRRAQAERRLARVALADEADFEVQLR
jgi:hypothetical protein